MSDEINDFHKQLADSESPEHDEFWDTAYKKLFPDMAWHKKSTAGKSQSQNLGFDRVIHFMSGKTIYIDEKLRDIDRGDIFIEFKSNSNSNYDDGWINKELQIDYIAYGIKDTKEVFLLDWLMLRKLWNKRGEEWKSEYRHLPAKNKGYTTYGIAIPKKKIMRELSVSSFTRVA